MTVGILHPGAMGSTVGASCTEPTIWLSEGRSEATWRRAEAAGIRPVAEFTEFVATADVIVSVCPPDAATETSRTVAATGFDGIYVDANAIAPATARAIAEQHPRFVDGGIIGPPVSGPGTTRLYLSGEAGAEVARLWEGTDLEVRLVTGGAGAASAVKTCFAAYTKGSTALLLAIRALAEAEGVSKSLLAEWDTSMPDLAMSSEIGARYSAPKAWRFSGEMHEVAQAFDDASLPSGFHGAAAQIYGRLLPFKDRDDVDFDEILAAILR